MRSKNYPENLFSLMDRGGACIARTDRAQLTSTFRNANGALTIASATAFLYAASAILLARRLARIS
jgi:hypothetical protein